VEVARRVIEKHPGEATIARTVSDIVDATREARTAVSKSVADDHE